MPIKKKNRTNLAIRDIEIGEQVGLILNDVIINTIAKSTADDMLAVYLRPNHKTKIENIHKVGSSIVLAARTRFQGVNIRPGDLVELKTSSSKKLPLQVHYIINDNLIILQRPGNRNLLNTFDKIRFLFKK